MPPKEIEQPLHAAELHRREAPRACGKPRLSLIVSLAPDDLDRLDFDAGEIDGSRRGSAHALCCPPRKIRAIGSANPRQDNHSTSVFIGRGHERAFDVTCARSQDFSAFEPGAPIPVDQPQPIRVVRVPDAEQLACPRFLRNQIDLLLVSIAKHELERVNMPLEQPPQGQAARTDRLQDLAEAKPESASPSTPHRQDRSEEARFMERSDVRRWKSAILIISAGARKSPFPRLLERAPARVACESKRVRPKGK